MTTSDRTIEQLTTALAGHYRFDRELGAGGMAIVYLAHDLKHDRDVAIILTHPRACGKAPVRVQTSRSF